MNITLKVLIAAVALTVSASAHEKKKACDTCKTCPTTTADGRKATLVNRTESKTVVVASNQFTRGVRSVRLAK